MADFSAFNVKGADWREQLRINNRKTRWVIFSFLFLYVVVGLVVDVFVGAGLYSAPPGAVLQAIFAGQLMPWATLIMLGIAAFSLLITYSMYDRIMLLGTDYRLISPDDKLTHEERQLYNVVEEMTVAAGLRYIPKVYIIDADYMNAFASGYSEKSAMVAITYGLMQKLTRSEMQAVMAHELSHIRHNDIKLTLTVGVLSNIMLIAIDMLFYGAIYSSRRREGDNRLFLIIMVLRFVLPIITVLLTMYLSRTREFMADAGSVELMRDNSPMASALLKIHNDHSANADYYQEEYGQTAHEDVRRAAYIFDPVKAGVEPVHDVSSLFSTHPTLDQRLKAIGFSRRQ